MFDNDVVGISKNLIPLKRGELEITDINRIYLQKEQLDVVQIRRGVAWLDTGTPKAMLQASNFF